jgi:hypothetical protein
VTEPYRGENYRECPLCGCPHRAGAVTCDGCGQNLDERPDLDSIREEYARRKRHRMLAAAGGGVMLGLNVALFHGAAYVLFAPFGWLAWNEIRLRHLRRALDRATGKT